MCFAHKHINKQTNKIIYVTDNNEIFDTNLEQYRLFTKVKK